MKNICETTQLCDKFISIVRNFYNMYLPYFV